MSTFSSPYRHIPLIGLIALLVLIIGTRFATPCPFCAGVQPSFLDELNDVSEFHIAACVRSMPHADEPGLFLAEFVVVEPLKSITAKKNKTTFTVPTFESLAAKKMYLVKGYGEETEFPVGSSGCHRAQRYRIPARHFAIGYGDSLQTDETQVLL
jgi:hypothetical protein